MTVGELIAALQQLDPNLRVVVDGYEGGLNDPDITEPFKMVLNVNEEHYYGPHEPLEAYTVHNKEVPFVMAICISR